MSAPKTTASRRRGPYDVEHKAKVSITLTEAQAVELRRRANARGTNVSALVRELLELHLCPPTPPACACGDPADKVRDGEPFCTPCAHAWDATIARRIKT